MAVAVQERPSAAPDTEGPWTSDYKLVSSPSFTDALSAITTLIFTYAGPPAFFNIAAEMKEPKHFTKALTLCQTTVTVVYIVVGVIVYYYCGSYVASPALGSAGTLVKKVSYGLALPGLSVSAILPTHVSTLKPFRHGRHLIDSTALRQIHLRPHSTRFEAYDCQ